MWTCCPSPAKIGSLDIIFAPLKSFGFEHMDVSLPGDPILVLLSVAFKPPKFTSRLSDP